MTPLQTLRHHISGAIARGEGVAIVEIPATPSAWRIERNHKMQFAVVRTTADGREVLTSASGRARSFKTYAAAVRACDAANRT